MTKSDQNYGPKLSITSTFLKFPEYNLLTKFIIYALLTAYYDYDTLMAVPLLI